MEEIYNRIDACGSDGANETTIATAKALIEYYLAEGMRFKGDWEGAIAPTEDGGVSFVVYNDDYYFTVGATNETTIYVSRFYYDKKRARAVVHEYANIEHLKYGEVIHSIDMRIKGHIYQGFTADIIQKALNILNMMLSRGLKINPEHKNTIGGIEDGGISLCLYNEKYVYTARIAIDGEITLLRYSFKKADGKALEFNFNDIYEFETRLYQI